MNVNPEEIYRDGSYRRVMESGLVKSQWSRIHRNMEKFVSRNSFEKILELGAGDGQHRRFVTAEWMEYHETDILYNNNYEYSRKSEARVHKYYQDAQDLSLDSDIFDRIVVSCVLVHLDKPLAALEEIKRVARPKANITLYLPCEPGLLLRIARSIFTMPKFRKAGHEDPYLQHFLQHKNYYLAINHFIRLTFSESRIVVRRYPFRYLSWNFNLYSIYHIYLEK